MQDFQPVYMICHGSPEYRPGPERRSLDGGSLLPPMRSIGWASSADHASVWCTGGRRQSLRCAAAPSGGPSLSRAGRRSPELSPGSPARFLLALVVASLLLPPALSPSRSAKSEDPPCRSASLSSFSPHPSNQYTRRQQQVRTTGNFGGEQGGHPDERLLVLRLWTTPPLPASPSLREERPRRRSNARLLDSGGVVSRGCRKPGWGPVGGSGGRKDEDDEGRGWPAAC